jgi:hypothetical protein
VDGSHPDLRVFCDRPDFETIARRKKSDFAQSGPAGRFGQGNRQPRRNNRQPVANLNRRRSMIQADKD